jgi:hypothetical protein
MTSPTSRRTSDGSATSASSSKWMVPRLRVNPGRVSTYAACLSPPGSAPSDCFLSRRAIEGVLSRARRRRRSLRVSRLTGDDYILESGRGIRILDHPERERLQGFGPGWIAGVSARSRLVGNAAIPHKSGWIGRRILDAVYVNSATLDPSAKLSPK